MAKPTFKEYVKMPKLPKKVEIFDTTLRDGEQTPGVALTVSDKIEIARQLDRLGVDIIEAGFALVTRGEFEAIEKLAKEGLNATICSLARTVKEDIDCAIKCGIDYIHTFIGTSNLHLKYKLRMSKEKAKQRAIDSVQYIKDHGITCEFSAEDATRTDLDYLKEIYRAVEEAGADKINVPDTVGVMVPEAMSRLISELEKVMKIPISVHCHNDFGLAVANSLAAIKSGAKQVHCTINGLGERAGNASLEQVVMSLYSLYGTETNIRTKLLYETSELVKRLTGITPAPNTPIIGENAFAHEAGIHTHGVLAKAETYEPLKPEMVGQTRRIVAGKHAGTRGIRASLKELGIKVNKEQLRQVTAQVKNLADMGREITDSELRAIAESVIGGIPEAHRLVTLEDLRVTTGIKITPKASVKLKIKGKIREGSAEGVGPVDAALNAIRATMGGLTEIKLKTYNLKAITGGSDALADVTVKIEDTKGRLYSARGVDDDIVMASVEALIEAINKFMVAQER
jgi:isopropylmalate/citramalate/homocitrate synthase-like protein